MFYKSYVLKSKFFSTDHHTKLYDDYSKRKNNISEDQWLQYTSDLRSKDELTKYLSPIIEDFISRPVPPEYNPALSTGNADYDYENLISNNGARIYTDINKYRNAVSEWKYNIQNFEINQKEKKYANMLGLILPSFK